MKTEQDILKAQKMLNKINRRKLLSSWMIATIFFMIFSVFYIIFSVASSSFNLYVYLGIYLFVWLITFYIQSIYVNKKVGYIKDQIEQFNKTKQL